MKRVTTLMVVLLVFVAIGNVQAELSDKQKAVQLAKCVADCGAISSWDPEPTWARLARDTSETFFAQAHRLYNGPSQELEEVFKQREGELLTLRAKEGRPATVKSARAAFNACADVSWDLLKSSGR